LVLFFFLLLGQLAAATNGTKNLPREIENNLELIKNSSFLANSYCTTSSLYSFISEIQGYKKTSMNISGIHQTQKPISIINQNEKHELCLKFGDQFLLFNKCTIKGTSFTTRHYSKSKQFQDCGVLYQYNDGCRFGIINKVIPRGKHRTLTPQSTKVSRSTWKYLEVPQSTSKYFKVP
jgi:hypothetical protein